MFLRWTNERPISPSLDISFRSKVAVDGGDSYFRAIYKFDKYCVTDSPVLKFTTISTKNMVSDRQLKAIHRVLRSSLKKLIATGKIIKLATNSRSMQRSQ